MSLRQGGKVIAGNNAGRNVGDIFWTMRKTNALNGAVECNGATYDTDDFGGTKSIGELLESGEVPYVSLADYATALTNDGSVGVFGWDGAGTTLFRVPSLNDIFIETGTAAQIGDYLPAGLPNITGTVKTGILWNDAAGATGCFTQSGSGGNKAYSNGSDTIRTANFDASRSSSVYKNDVTTVQPNTVRYRAMVQLATGATDEALETCTAVTAQVAANTAAIAGADYVVESQLPTADNNRTWYRKYKSGWVEQGGIIKLNSFSLGSGSTSNWNRLTFPVALSQTPTDIYISDNMAFFNNHHINVDSTGMQIKTSNQLPVSYTQAACEINWRVSGMIAS